MQILTSQQINHIKGAMESLLFVNEKPVTLEQMTKAIDTLKISEIKDIIHSLMKDYQEKNGGIIIVEIAGGYQMLSNSHYAAYIRNFYKTKHKEKLSKPSLETAAIIAYKQPITRGDVEIVRGVNSDGVVANLLNKELIKIVGRRDVAGKPYLYGTTRQFLEYFGLKSLDNLPKLEELSIINDKIGASQEDAPQGKVIEEEKNSKADLKVSEEIYSVEQKEERIQEECQK